MVSKIEIVLIGFTLVQIAFAYDYQSKIFSQRVTHYNNDYVGFGVKFYGDEGYPYLTLNEPITPYNDLHIMLYAKIYDQAPNLLANAPLSICQLLHDNRLLTNHTVLQYNIPQIYNLQGKQCPIDQKTLRLSPYVFPSSFSTDINLGCGYMNIESRLMKCNNGIEEQRRNCETLVKTLTLAFIVNEECNEEDLSTYQGASDSKVKPIKEL